MSRLRKLWPALAILILTLLPLWRCVFGSETIGAWDEVRQAAPWNGPATGSWDVLQADSVLEFYGWRDQVFNAWGKGHLPLWNPYELNGTPLLANSQSGALYPPHVLTGVLHIPTGLGMALLAWGHLCWCGVGVYLVCRCLGGGQLSALLGAVGFALSPFMVGWVALPSVVETVAWIPWLLLGAYRLPARTGFSIIALSVAMMFLAGHLQFAVYGVLALIAVLFVRAIQVRRAWLSLVGSGLLAFVAGVLIAAPQLLPVLHHGQMSHRRNTPTAEGFSAYNAGALPIWELLSLPDSRLLGQPTDSLAVGTATVNGFWPSLVQRGGNFAESAIGVGPVVLLLLAAGLRKRVLAAAAGISVLGAAGLLLAIGSPVGAMLFFLVPGWSATGSPGRGGVLLVLALCVLAGTTFGDEISADEQPKRNRLGIFIGIVAISVAVLFALPLSPWVPTLTTDDLRSIVPHASIALTVLLLALVVAVLGAAAMRFAKVRLPLCLAMTVLMAVFPAMSLVRSSSTLLPTFKAEAERVAIVTGAWDLLQPSHTLLPPNTAALLGIHEAGGYDSIVDKSVRDRLAEVDGEDPAPPANGNMMFVKKHFDPQRLADLGVTQVWSLEPLEQFVAPVSQDSGIYKYNVPGPGRASIPNGTVNLMRETAEWSEFEVTGPGTLTLRDNFDEGWSARIDDNLTELALTPWPHLIIPRGRHSIHFQYWPVGMTRGFQALGVGLVIIAIYMVTSRRSSVGLSKPVVQ